MEWSFNNGALSTHFATLTDHNFSVLKRIDPLNFIADRFREESRDKD